MKNKTQKLMMIAALSFSLSACGTAERISNIGKEPEFTKLENPIYQPDYQPVSLPMPNQAVEASRTPDLFQGSARQPGG